MTHHSTFCTTASAERVSRSNGSAGSPTLSTATPIATESTISCRTLKERTPSGEDCRPRMLCGTRPVRKSHQDPVVSGAAWAAASTELLRPGSVSRPRPMPIETAIRAVTANQRSVWPASRRGVRDLLEVGDADDHGGDDQRRDEDLQQRDEGAADGLEGAGQPVGRAVGDGAQVTGDETEGHTHDEGEEDLRRERDAAETCEHRSAPFGSSGKEGDDGSAGVNSRRSSPGRSPGHAVA